MNKFVSELGVKYRNEVERQQLRISDEAMVFLCRYGWPGNVRQLQNEVERMLLLSGQETHIGVEFLSEEVRNGEQQTGSFGMSMTDSDRTLKEVLAEVERELIVNALDRCAGNKSEAARRLDISRSSLITKVKQYRIEEE